MGIFEFFVPTRVEFGPDSSARLGYYIGAAGKRVIIVSDGILSLSEPLRSVEGVLKAKGIESIVYDAVFPNADSVTAEDAAQLARKSRANVVIGLGGARACSIAKIVAFLCENGGGVADYLAGREGNGRRAFYVGVPTVFRDVYALSGCAFVTDGADQTNKLFSPRGTGTDMLFVDPSLMAGLPQKTGTSTALDILALSIEGYVSVKVNPLVEPMLLRGIELVFSSLPLYLKNPADGSAREKLCTAGLFTSIANAVTGFGIAFALSMGMNGRNRVPKSTVTPILLPHVLEYGLSACAPRLAKIARVLGRKTESAPETYAAAMCIDALKKFRESLGVPLPVRLSQLGLQKDDLAEAAEVALRFEDVNSVPRKASFQGLMEILERAF